MAVTGNVAIRTEIVAVGTELLLGQIANTNAQWLSQKLSEIGINIYFHTAVGDNAGRLRDALSVAISRANLILLTGGLGPTEDDLTKETVARFLGKELVMHADTLAKITAYFQQREKKMTDNNRKQALIIKGSQVFPNDRGMAPGMAVEAQGIWYVLLPGPPRELEPMFSRYVAPYLQSLFPQPAVIYSKVLRFYGIGESELVDNIQDLISAQTNPTIAPLAGEREVTLRLTAKATGIEEAERIISPVSQELYKRFSNFIYGEGEVTLQAQLVKALQTQNATLAVAESCTGGLLAHWLTSVSGSSKVFPGGVVTYSLAAKEKVLEISPALLETYGAVSKETAEAMASQARALYHATYGIGITGIAGPEALEGKPVGLVWIAWSTPERQMSREYRYAGTRHDIQVQAAKSAMFQLIKVMS